MTVRDTEKVVLTHRVRKPVHAERERYFRRHAPPSGRFGDVAVELGLVTQEVLDECLAIQGQFRSTLEDACICGWTAQPTSERVQSVQNLWFVFGVSLNVREVWNQALGKYAIKLESVYPLVSCSAAVLEGSELAATVLEVQPGLLAATRLEEGCVVDFRLLYTAGRPPSTDMFLKLIGYDSVADVWLAGSNPRLRELTSQLADQLGRNVGLVPVVVGGQLADQMPLEPLANLVGAARHALHLVPANRATCVPGGDATEPLFNRAPLWGAAASLLVGAAVGTAEIRQSLQMNRVSHARNQAQLLLDAAQRKVEQLEIRSMKVKELAARIAPLQEESNIAERQIAFFQSDLEVRDHAIPALLDAIADAATNDVVVNRIKEINDQLIHVVGWALSDVAAERFADSLGTALRPWGLVLIEPATLQEKQGRLGLPGYTVELRFGAASSEVKPLLLTNLTEGSL